jgi:chromosome segregation ATPase
VHSLEAQVGFTSRDKDAAIEALATLRTEHDALREQQTHWGDLRRTTEQLERLSALVTRSQANEPELKELRRIRDRSKVLESDHAALQLRYKEQEMRADEWEQHANESETVLADAQGALEDAEHRAAQLAEEFAKAKAAEERLAMVCLFFLSLCPRCRS